MKKHIKFLAIIIVFTMLISIVPRYSIAPIAINTAPKADSKVVAGVAEQGLQSGSWMEEISNNGANAGIVTVPPVIRVANADYGLDNQALSATDCSTIQTQVINYATRTMQSYSTSISITLPSGASSPSLTASSQGASVITIVADNTGGNPYTWHISGGNAVAGNYIDYTFTYNLNGRQYTQKSASYIDLVELGAGWQTYVERRNFSDVTHTRHEYTAVLAGSCSTGAGYAVYGNSGTGYYKMASGGGSTGFAAGAGGIYSGMKLWDPGDDNRENCSVWYCGQPGKDGDNNDNVDGGYRANLDVYYDPSVVTNISQLGIKLLYWRSTTPNQIATMYQDKMIYLLGNPLFSNGDSSNGAQSYFHSTNANNNQTQYIDSNPGTMTFNFAGTALPPDGQKVTFASAIYGCYETQVYLTTWDAWLITFHVVQKSVLRSLIAIEDTAFRQIHDGYTNTDGSFTAYLTQLAKSKAVLNQPNASAAQITAAVNDLNTAKNNFKYVPANYTALNTLVSNVYNADQGYRPSPTLDPDYYLAGPNYYPSGFYQSTSALAAVLASVEYGHDIRYQAYINSMVASVNSTWRAIVLKNSDYAVVDSYLNQISGLNDLTGSPAGNYITANGTIYPQYLDQMLYWNNYTDTSYTNWESAVYGVTLGLKIPDQTLVTGMGTALQTAFESMTIKVADYTELDTVRVNALAAINSKVYVQNPEGGGHFIATYTTASINAMQAKLNSIVDGLLMPEQGTVINWTDELQALVNAKIINNADYLYANAQKAIPATYEADHSTFYTTASWQALVNARNAVQSGKHANEQIAVDSWALSILDARNSLVYNAAELSALLTAINSAAALTESSYTPSSWAILANALSAGVAIRDTVPVYSIMRQEEVDAAVLAINGAITGLVYKDADYSAVNVAIAAANALKASNYSNWVVVQTAIDAVVYGYNITEQTLVNGYASAILNAISTLVYIDADLTGLHEAIDSTATLIESLYTAESWGTLAGAVSAGSAIRDAVPSYNITQQAAVDAAVLAINNAIAGLTEAAIALEAASGSTAVIDTGRGYIYGLTADGSLSDLVIQGYVNIIGFGHLEYTPASNGFGTGTKVELVRDGDNKVMTTYYIVIFGDADGDGYANGNDACITSLIAAGMLTQGNLGDIAYYAADANQDGFVDSLDAQLLEHAGLFLTEIIQTAI